MILPGFRGKYNIFENIIEKNSLCEKCPYTGKCGPENNPYLHTFYAVITLYFQR